MTSPHYRGKSGNTDRFHDEYTVGWVCALPIEQAAAIAMLDQQHPDLSKPENDPNTYTLGSIGNHNIVVACLPKGKIGTAAAANIVSQMIRTFPAIRVGLMVGIGGGIPPYVRLGDVVVSAPAYDYPGVVQWDIGILEDGSQLRRIGALNNPPTSLLTALSKLEAQHRLTRPRIQDYLEERRRKYPDSPPTYLRTETMRDVLFNAGYSHIHNLPPRSWLHIIMDYTTAAFLWFLGLLLGFELFNSSTSLSHIHSEDTRKKQEDDQTIEDDCQYCDKSQVVVRSPRGMLVHQGLIASGNKVIKDAAFRDALNGKFGGNVLCVEMEAAGLMDNFPCIVVRGICDYADSHKNYAWQDHAAAIAAAYTKEFLQYVQPSEVSLEKPATQIMHHVMDIGRDVKRLQSVEDRKENLKIFDWLSSIDYGSHQSDILEKWCPETNQWFLGSDAFQEWLHGRGKSMFCPGIPGAGKSVLTSAVINYLNNNVSTGDIGISYVYCNFSRKDTLENYLGSLIKQLVKRQDSPSLKVVRDLYEKHKYNETRPSRDELSQTLHDVLALSTYNRVFIMIDALDECSADNECRIRLIHEILDLQTKHKVNTFTTSRMIEEIAVHFQNAVTVPIHATEDDMRIYINKRLRVQDNELFDDAIRQMIISKLVEAAGGMFLLIELYLDSLIASPTIGDIKQALGNLATGPAGLDTAYDFTMERIRNQGKAHYELAKQIFAWIIYRLGPINVKELQYALAIKPGMKVFDNDFVPSVKKILSVCGGLVEIGGYDVIGLFHYTADEYLRKTQSEWLPDPHSKLATICMTYVQIFDSVDLRPFPLHRYAIFNWGNHLRLSSNFNLEDTLSFLKGEVTIQILTQPLFLWPSSLHRVVGLHIAAYYGLEEVVSTLLHSHDVDIRDSEGRTPLHLAAIQGHEAVFKLLCSKGADVNAQDVKSNTPILTAASNDQIPIVKLLLANDQVDFNHTARGRTALHMASSLWGEPDMFKVLLHSRRVDPNIRDEQGRTILFNVIRSDQKIVKALLDFDSVNPNLQDNLGNTPLSEAVSNAKHRVVEWLLADKRVDPNLQDIYGQTALLRAMEEDFPDVVEELLASETVDPNVRDENGNTPLWHAAGYREAKIVKLLCACERTDLNARNIYGQTALSGAIEEENEVIVKALLSFEGVDPTVEDDYGDTSLSIALRTGNQAIINMLLFSGKVDSIPDVEEYYFGVGGELMF